MDQSLGKELDQMVGPYNVVTLSKRDFFIIFFSDFESASKALTAMCEIASEACQTWFPAQEK